MVDLGLDGRKLHTVYNSLSEGTDPERNRLLASEIYHSRFGNRLPVVIFSGRLTKEKRLDLLLDAYVEQALEGLSQAQSWLDFTNFFVEKADFLKIRNIGVNYTFRPGKVLKNVTVGFNVYNPFSFTASSVDPEASLSGALSQGAVATSGINYSTYSTPRQYIGTVRIGF